MAATDEGSEDIHGSERGRIRAFVALALPDPVLSELVAWQEQALGRHPSLRGTARASMHLTLAFLGERDVAEIASARAVVAELEPGPVALRLEPTPVAVPARRPRVLAFGAVSPDAITLQAKLVRRLVEEGAYESEARGFWPHLSIARVRGDPRGARRVKAWASALPPLPEAVRKPFHAVRIALYRSHLRPQGPHYISLADVDLPPEEGGG